MIKPKNETKEFLFSITKNCETLLQQTHGKAEETLEFKFTKPWETFHFQSSLSIEGSLMLGVASVEVYNSIFNYKLIKY